MNQIRRAIGWLLCLIGDHDWTSRHQRGEVPDMEKVMSIEYFYEWSTMFCDRCGHIHENQRTTS